MRRRDGSGGQPTPPIWTTIACGARLNQVIACSSTNARATTLSASIHGWPLRARNSR